ncbi:hypothetical protein HNQ07_001535 [Deinococcus metalli]|uniref:DUF3103 family protein n=1 Tax=Deinococcus metalli TaxID=1141878 RepID=A0A7W8KE57_9DEIO|nr:DUF3103 family protein [Deinococcus metalli]MBB5376078.1 hypothetical protein [Deinococcus metalli]GHF40971.1 hypothetical protein GCM10017781_17050 [Deinococcus metalli]
MTVITRAVPAALLAVTLALSACGQTPQTAATAGTPAVSAADAQVNAALDAFAQDLARHLQSPELRATILQQTDARFDGDRETLYAALARAPLGGGTVESLLASGPGETLHPLGTVTGSVRNLQVAVRGPAWDAATHVPLVAVAPQGGDEFAPVVAYDAQGGRHVLDGRTAPSEAVVVVGVNERVDAQGHVMIPIDVHAGAAPPSPVPSGTVPSSPGLSAQACDSWERLSSLYVRDDHEPWVRGDPEIYVQLGSNSRDGLYVGSLPDVNDENRWYTPNRDLIRWSSTTLGSWMMYLWYERDGGSSVTLTFGADVRGVNGSVSYTVADGDDQMGHAALAFGDRLSTFALDTGDVRWWRSGCK